MTCVFCSLLEHPDRPLDLDGKLWVAFEPLGPVNDGHRLLIPRRHMERFDQLSDDEAGALPRALRLMRLRVGALDYNLGVNAGAIAGQTVFHLHVHLVPRTAGDVADPAGGIVGALGDRLADHRKIAA